jgi:hypothetical protein
MDCDIILVIYNCGAERWRDPVYTEGVDTRGVTTAQFHNKRHAVLESKIGLRIEEDI